MLKIALIPGDGVGREVVVAAQRILQHLNRKKSPKYAFKYLDAGWDTFQRTGNALPEETLIKLQKCHGALFGAVQSPSQRVKGYSSPIVQLRKSMDLYANVRPLQAPNLDMVVYRENTECLYIKKERESVDQNGLKSAIAERLITESASRRIGRMAYLGALNRALVRGSSSLTIVHKSNVLSLTDGLFRESVHDEINVVNAALRASDNPLAKFIDDTPVREQLVDSAVYKLFYNRLNRPDSKEFDVLVAPNMYGDILSDAGAALVGSLGLVAGANICDSFCLGEPVHGSAPDIAVKELSYKFEQLGTDTSLQQELINRSVANPVATIRSLAMMLRHIGQLEDATAIEQATNEVLQDTSLSVRMTKDMTNGKGKLKDVLALIIERL